MTILSLAAVKLLENSNTVPLLWTIDRGVSEPFYDYNEFGEPEDFGIDIEPDKPTLEEIESALLPNIYDVSPADFAEVAIRIPEAGRISDFDFKDRRYLKRIYESSSSRILLKAGRQVEKSTTIGNRMLAYSAILPNFRTLYVSPSAEQSKVFSADRIKDVIDSSPRLRAYTTSRLTQAVFFKRFINFSTIRLRYCYLTADRVRGIPADLVNIDEIQDILVDNIPVIEQCSFHSNYKLFLYSGTPKTEDNTLEHYWVEFSTQNEWVVPCRVHGVPKDASTWHWNILSEKNVGKNGLICDKCGSPISAADPEAQWVSLNPQTEYNKEKVTFEGYRIPQIMVPWVDWQEILNAMSNYPRAQLMNEKFGLSYDSGLRPISKNQLKLCCKPHIRLGDIEHIKRVVQGKPVYAGIDWGCHDEETQILTDRGFVYFPFLTYTHKVAQWDPESRILSFSPPEEIVSKNYDGTLLHFENEYVDMMLTAEHKMWVYDGQWHQESAIETSKKTRVHFVSVLFWKGEVEQTIYSDYLPQYFLQGRNAEEVLPYWLEFLGHYVIYGDFHFSSIKMGGLDLKLRMKYAKKEPSNLHKVLEYLGIKFHKINENGVDICAIEDKKVCGIIYRELTFRNKIPRKILSLPASYLKILFESMTDQSSTKEGVFSYEYQLPFDDLQEICLRIGLQSTLCENVQGYSLHWSPKKTVPIQLEDVSKVSYKGKVYCCKVPTGFIVTRRKGKLGFQGNTGEGTYTVLSFGGYLGSGNFTIFYIHRFIGPDIEPDIQLDIISQMLTQLQALVVGADYGGGFYMNKMLVNRFGPDKIIKYQYNYRQKKKILWEPNLLRYMCHRTEVMSDIFTAFRRRLIDLPCWEDFADPYGSDILNIFSEYNARLRMMEYKHSPGKTDDAFHSILLCLLASMIQHPRPDIIRPPKEKGILEAHYNTDY